MTKDQDAVKILQCTQILIFFQELTLQHRCGMMKSPTLDMISRIPDFLVVLDILLHLYGNLQPNSDVVFQVFMLFADTVMAQEIIWVNSLIMCSQKELQLLVQVKNPQYRQVQALVILQKLTRNQQTVNLQQMMLLKRNMKLLKRDLKLNKHNLFRNKKYGKQNKLNLLKFSHKHKRMLH